MNIIELAKEAGFSITTDWIGRPTMVSIGTNGDIGLKGTEELEAFAALVRAEVEAEWIETNKALAKEIIEREWVDLTDDEKVMLSDRLNLDRRIVVIDAVIAAFKEKNK